MIDNNDNHDDNYNDKDNHLKNHHRPQDRPPSVRNDDHKIKIERFMKDMHRYLITIKREEFPEKCIQNLRKHLDDHDQDSDEESWAPPRPALPTRTGSFASSIRSTSSPFFNNDDNDDDHEDQSSSLSLHSAIISSTDDEVQNGEDRDIIFDASTDDHSDDNGHHRPLSSTPKTPRYQFQDDDLDDVTLIQDREKPKKSRKSKSKLTSV